tara:strand:+ start:2228 stop:2425 length:198 start_codon:yes stop_codon:yes gene_type:complete
MNIKNENGYLPGSYFDTEVKRLERRPTWELRNMIKALKIHPWLNTNEQRVRLEAAQVALKNKRAA